MGDVGASGVHGEPPSAWVLRFLPLLPAGGEVLDVACGAGRHVRCLRQHGHPVVAVDRDVAVVRAIADAGVEVVEADLESGPWPFAARRFAGVLVTRYLWRPLLPRLVAAVDAGGVLIYETFAEGQQAFGRPTHPDFLLQPGELLQAVDGELTVVAYEHGPYGQPPRAVLQRLCARRPGTMAS